ncbi:hypothetical protein P3S68_033266 [Capsicum galapagoense]
MIDKKREKAAPPEEEEDWERIYSYEEKRVKAYINPDRQGCINWEKKNRSWEIQKGLIPTFEEEEMMQKPLILVCGKEEEGREEAKRKKAAPPEDWEKEYSCEEKMLKARLDKQGYGEWEKKHRLWEILNYLVPVAEGDKKEKQRQYEVRYLLALLSLRDPVIAKELLEKRLDKLLKKEPISDILDLLASDIIKLPPGEGDPTIPLTPEGLQYLRDNAHPAPVFSWEEEREKFAPQAKAEGRCLDGSYLIPYCKCNKQSYHFDRT